MRLPVSTVSIAGRQKRTNKLLRFVLSLCFTASSLNLATRDKVKLGRLVRDRQVREAFRSILALPTSPPVYLHVSGILMRE